MAYVHPDKYNSDFTEYHHKRVSEKQTLMDIDAVQFKILPDGTERMRLVEYKHRSESLRPMQKAVLDRFSMYFKVLNEKAVKTEFEVYVIKANFSKINDQIILDGNVEIINLITEETKIINNEEEFILFLEFKIDWSELYG